MSSTNVVFEEGPTPWLSVALPAFKNLLGVYIVALLPSIILESTTDQAWVLRLRTSVSDGYSELPIWITRPSGRRYMKGYVSKGLLALVSWVHELATGS